MGSIGVMIFCIKYALVQLLLFPSLEWAIGANLCPQPFARYVLFRYAEGCSRKLLTGQWPTSIAKPCTARLFT
eukprot:scaffold355951_cov34-Prasinocladus_malaysianus.AAC.1